MNFKIYKEGEGKWARNSVAAFIALLSVYGTISLYEMFADPGSIFEIKNSVWEGWFSVSSWPIDYRLVIAFPLLTILMLFGFWQYNRPRWADFLIDMENELKNRVTWPSRKEVAANSIVVVVTVLILGIYIFFADMSMQTLQDWVYKQFY